MTLSSMIRKRDTGNLATAIPAIFATQLKREAATVARIATVAVANHTERKCAPESCGALSEVMRWLVYIEEKDQKLIDEVIALCREEPGALTYFLWRAVGNE